MIRIVPFAAACALLVAPTPAMGQRLPADSVFSRLAGRWVLRGTIAKHQTTHDITFDWVLGREYLQMREVSRERAADGKPAYEAVVLFGHNPRTGNYASIWMDNTAAMDFPPEGRGEGHVSGDSLTFVFGGSPAEGFRTTFLYHPGSDSWEWHMDNDSLGVLRPFARVTLTRAPH